MRLAVINDYLDLAREAADWARLAPGIDVRFHGRVSEAEAPQLLADCDMVVTAREETRFDAGLLEHLPQLRLLVTHGMSNAALDLPALAARGVTVCGTGLGFTMATVELAWGLILGLVKHIPAEDRTIREGGWGAGLGRGLTGRRLGLLGLGGLGADMARVGQAFGMEVIAWSENLTQQRCAELGVRLVGREALFAESDVLSIHMRFSSRTRSLVGRAELGAMRPDAILVNTSRGPIVDEAALVDALRSRSIAAAGLDVFDREPLPPDHPFRSLPNTLLTSHIGGRTRENILARYREAFEDVQAWLAGHPIRVVAAPLAERHVATAQP
ncbi:D-2-hydroxyacid dehydrogenase family protein [Roseomonas sp. SSH11]|uniref:D-2-hydroxyacid dehydrogenase family protein n=1 Tax=Pararoseomonas baculiformis TaxID=2820812 RepID=A0ABS4AKM2_9PROT|nr:D-2-hydroxyacid dehydrogenase family protein [Pararoseomonas baculiformis]MBP0447585.1 D-2-hydroxyacid dehydrogenase family protein [Pararoseomonas baculiformis]